MTSTSWQACIGVGQCVVRSVEAQTEPEHATITMSSALRACVARALMDMTQTQIAGGMPARVSDGIAGIPEGK